MKRLTTLLLAFIMTFALAGCSSKPKTKTVTTGALSITIGEDYEEMALDGFDGAYSNDDVAIAILKENFEDFYNEGYEAAKDMTLEEYTELVKAANEGKCTFEVDDTGYPSSTYTADVEGVSYKYYTTIRTTKESGYLISFITFESAFDTYFPEIKEYAKSIKVE